MKEGGREGRREGGHILKKGHRGGRKRKKAEKICVDVGHRTIEEEEDAKEEELARRRREEEKKKKAKKVKLGGEKESKGEGGKEEEWVRMSYILRNLNKHEQKRLIMKTGR